MVKRAVFRPLFFDRKCLTYIYYCGNIIYISYIIYINYIMNIKKGVWQNESYYSCKPERRCG